MTSPHPAIAPGKVAVVTGGASGIGLATARKLRAERMALCLIDSDAQALASAEADFANDGLPVLALGTDVSDRAQLEAAAHGVAEKLGPVSVLMNNAAVAAGGEVLADPLAWTRLIGVNLMGVFHGLSVFLPAMLASDLPGLVINTGSKQGITQPPGNTAYNVAKTGVKAMTEGLAHTLREKSGDRITAHLLVPGFTYTGMMRRRIPEKPAGAWLPEQVADYLFDALARRDFYIICPDNETTPDMDRKRIMWSLGDMIENRPALSRWHPDYSEAFADFMNG